mmetsp:Transcript_216/g.971  ORF Transcript_216/g.971 Transcript_216/m.971 type:complete len:226 (+) Transcript_216:1520-2197(+)
MRASLRTFAHRRFECIGAHNRLEFASQLLRGLTTIGSHTHGHLAFIWENAGARDVRNCAFGVEVVPTASTICGVHGNCSVVCQCKNTCAVLLRKTDELCEERIPVANRVLCDVGSHAEHWRLLKNHVSWHEGACSTEAEAACATICNDRGVCAGFGNTLVLLHEVARADLEELVRDGDSPTATAVVEVLQETSPPIQFRLRLQIPDLTWTCRIDAWLDPALQLQV